MPPRTSPRRRRGLGEAPAEAARSGSSRVRVFQGRLASSVELVSDLLRRQDQCAILGAVVDMVEDAGALRVYAAEHGGNSEVSALLARATALAREARRPFCRG